MSSLQVRTFQLDEEIISLYQAAVVSDCEVTCSLQRQFSEFLTITGRIKPLAVSNYSLRKFENWILFFFHGMYCG